MYPNAAFAIKYLLSGQIKTKLSPTPMRLDIVFINSFFA